MSVLKEATSPEEAEKQLLDLVRGQDTKAFTLTISCVDGRWTVLTTDHASGGHRVGHGACFAEAWLGQEPPGLLGDESSGLIVP